jgi:hypothetical protein
VDPLAVLEADRSWCTGRSCRAGLTLVPVAALGEGVVGAHAAHIAVCCAVAGEAYAVCRVGRAKDAEHGLVIMTKDNNWYGDLP